MSKQKFKYLENEKSFYGEIKSIFRHFLTAFIEENNFFFLEGETPALSFYPTVRTPPYLTHPYCLLGFFCPLVLFQPPYLLGT